MTNYEMRALARKVAENVSLANLVGSQVYNIAKNGKRKLSSSEIYNIDNLADFVPADVMGFLKNKVKIPKFVDMIREEIFCILDKKELETEVLIRYSIFFNLKLMKKIKIDSFNKAKLLLIICMEEEGIFDDVDNANAEEIDKIFENLYLNPEEDDGRYVKAIENYSYWID